MRVVLLGKPPACQVPPRCLWPHLQQSHPEKGLTYLTQTQRPGDCVAEKKSRKCLHPLWSLSPLPPLQPHRVYVRVGGRRGLWGVSRPNRKYISSTG